MALNEPQQIGIWDRRMAEIAQRDVQPDPTLVRIVTGLDIRLKQALDLGCGAGRHLCWLAANGWVATGLDWSQEAVETTKRALLVAGLKASVVKGDLKSIKLTPGSYPLIICTAVLHHNRMDGFRRSMIEIKRMLKIGGYAVISLPTRDHPGAHRPGSWAEEGTLIPSSGPEMGIPHHYFTEDEIRTATSQFRSVVIERPLIDGKPGTSGMGEPAKTDSTPPLAWDGQVRINLAKPDPPRRDPLLPPEPLEMGDPLAVKLPETRFEPNANDWYWVVLKG